MEYFKCPSCGLVITEWDICCQNFLVPPPQEATSAVTSRRSLFKVKHCNNPKTCEVCSGPGAMRRPRIVKRSKLILMKGGLS